MVCKLSDQRVQDVWKHRWILLHCLGNCRSHPQIGQDQEPLGDLLGVEGTMNKSKEMKSLKKKQRNLVDVIH